MSITSSYGFRSAQAAYENTNPYDNDCTCEGEGFVCDDCGHIADTPGTCPDTEENHPDDATQLRAIEADEVPDYFPNANCRQHGWCTGCTRRNCEDCGGDDHDDRD